MHPEFLDELSHIAPWVPKKKLEPWRDSPMDVVLIPLEAVIHFTDPAKLAFIEQFEYDQVEALRLVICSEGLKSPLEMVIDIFGKLTLRNGHHRLLALRDLGENEIPVYFLKSNNVRTFCRPLHEELPYLIRTLMNRAV